MQGWELEKREGTNKRDSEVTIIEVEWNSRENSTPETKGRKDFQGGRESKITYVKCCWWDKQEEDGEPNTGFDISTIWMTMVLTIKG